MIPQDHTLPQAGDGATWTEKPCRVPTIPCPAEPTAARAHSQKLPASTDKALPQRNITPIFGSQSLRQRNMTAIFGSRSLRQRNMAAIFGSQRLPGMLLPEGGGEEP